MSIHVNRAVAPGPHDVSMGNTLDSEARDDSSAAKCTLCIVNLPKKTTYGLGVVNVIDIEVVRPDGAKSTLHSMIPAGIEESDEQFIRIEHSREDLDVEKLVLDLFQLGCGSDALCKELSLPYTLPNGACISEICSSGTWVDRNFTFNPPRRYSTLKLPDQQDEINDPSSDHALGKTSQSPISSFTSPASFMTGNSPASFMSARSTFNSPAYYSPAYPHTNALNPTTRIETIREEGFVDPSLSDSLQNLSIDYWNQLHEKELVLPFDKELNWSGKGQHVIFLPAEVVPLSILSHLGASMTATVDRVLCKRVALARKTMRCSRKWTIADALQEVYHLQNLRHHHIIQLVGTYLQSRNFSILVYPAAECHLGRFLEDTEDAPKWNPYVGMLNFLASTLSCLTSAVAFVHQNVTKHMDIKPQNILVGRNFHYEHHTETSKWQVYLADFGLSRSFAAQDYSQTDGPTSRTPRYCAPEVYGYDSRGRSADIFSLGCVFLEILTILCRKSLDDFAEHRRHGCHDESFHANLEHVRSWADKLPSNDWLYADCAELVMLVKSMVEHDPERRPTASHIQGYFAALERSPYRAKSCCSLGPEPYIVYADYLSLFDSVSQQDSA